MFLDKTSPLGNPTTRDQNDLTLRAGLAFVQVGLSAMARARSAKAAANETPAARADLAAVK
jgi:hypothetical protein